MKINKIIADTLISSIGITGNAFHSGASDKSEDPAGDCRPPRFPLPRRAEDVVILLLPREAGVADTLDLRG